MRTALLVCLVVGLCQVARAQEGKPSELIVGTWEAGDADEKIVLNFGEDGKLLYVSKDVVAGLRNYKFVGDDKMELRDPNLKDVTDELTVKISKTELSITAGKSKESWFPLNKTIKFKKT